MPNECQTRGGRNAQLARGQGTDGAAYIAQLGREGIVSELVRQRELACVVHTTAAEVRGYCGEARAGKALGDLGKHSPVLEAFESMDHEHCRPGRRSSTRAN